MLRSHLQDDVLPWQHTMINGWILDPDRKKMSKSKDNVLTPMPLVEEYGADALRYWCSKSAPGTDTAISRPQMKIGRRLAIKLLNASRFVLGVVGDSPDGIPAPGVDRVTHAVDRAMLAQLRDVVVDATDAFEGYAYHRALERVETFFWRFCDDYLELVKQRSFGDDEDALSARTALQVALECMLRLFAPFLPFTTEEVWSWWRTGSVHTMAWPEVAELADAVQGADPGVLDTLSDVLIEIRRAKTTHRRSQRSPVERLVVADTADRLRRIEEGAGDLCNAGSVTDLVLTEAVERAVSVELAEISQEPTTQRPGTPQAQSGG